MTAIKISFGSGGGNITPSNSQGTPDLATTLRDIADDLDGIQVGTIASADASDLATAITLVNEIKAALNVNAAVVLKTTKA